MGWRQNDSHRRATMMMNAKRYQTHAGDIGNLETSWLVSKRIPDGQLASESKLDGASWDAMGKRKARSLHKARHVWVPGFLGASASPRIVVIFLFSLLVARSNLSPCFSALVQYSPSPFCLDFSNRHDRYLTGRPGLRFACTEMASLRLFLESFIFIALLSYSIH